MPASRLRTNVDSTLKLKNKLPASCGWMPIWKNFCQLLRRSRTLTACLFDTFRYDKNFSVLASEANLFFLFGASRIRPTRNTHIVIPDVNRDSTVGAAAVLAWSNLIE